MKTATCAISVTALLGTGLGFSPDISCAQDRWTESIVVNGDIRLRYEAIDEEGEEDRKRGRFRALLSLTADINENVTAILQFATGGGNPVSNNQTFGDGFSRKDIGLDPGQLLTSPHPLDPLADHDTGDGVVVGCSAATCTAGAATHGQPPVWSHETPAAHAPSVHEGTR